MSFDFILMTNDIQCKARILFLLDKTGLESLLHLLENPKRLPKKLEFSRTCISHCHSYRSQQVRKEKMRQGKSRNSLILKSRGWGLNPRPADYEVSCAGAPVFSLVLRCLILLENFRFLGMVFSPLFSLVLPCLVHKKCTVDSIWSLALVSARGS